MSSKNVAAGIKSEADAGDDLKRQGSFRKLLPLNTNGETQLAMSAKMIDRPTTSQNNKEYAIFLQEYVILSEYNLLQKQDLKGIYVIPSVQNSFLWFGVIFIRQGIYQGAVFRFTIALPQTFPDGHCPKIVFQSDVFHPLIHPDTGEFDTTWGFPEWRRTTRVYQLVQYIVKVFTKIDPKMTPVNQVAIDLFQNDLESFKSRAKESVKDSLDRVYDPPLSDDAHYIAFTPYDSSLYDEIRTEIFKPKDDEETKTLGFSWVQPGSLQPFSKPETR